MFLVESWAEQPPAHILLAAIAAAHGFTFDRAEREEGASSGGGGGVDALAELLAAIPERPTIADLAASARPVPPGGDTIQASLDVARAMKGTGGD